MVHVYIVALTYDTDEQMLQCRTYYYYIYRIS